MFHPACKVGLVAFLLGVSLAAAQEMDVPQVRDEAKLFGADAIEKVNKTLATIREKHRTDLLIETVPEIAADVKDTSAWARERFKKHGGRGVYVVISAKPRRFEIVIDTKVADAGLFGQTDVDELIKIMGKELRQDRDEALRQVAAYTLERMDRHAKVAAELKDVLGTWGGPLVEVVLKRKKEGKEETLKSKAWLFLRFNAAGKNPYVDVGYLTPPDKKSITGFVSMPFELKEGDKKKQVSIAKFDAEGPLVLTYEVKEGVLHVEASRKVRLNFVPGGPVDLTGEWKRPMDKDKKGANP